MKKAICCLAIFAIFWQIASIGILAGEYKLPDTGQIECYGDGYQFTSWPSPGQPFYGQDAQYEGPQPAYQDNGDGTVTDLNTGLMWQQGDTHLSPHPHFYKARRYCESLTLAGHSDWRIPDRRELLSIVDYGRFNPAINPVFSFCYSSDYWSGDTDASGGGGEAWCVDFNYGDVDHWDKGDYRHVRCVRGGP